MRVPIAETDWPWVAEFFERTPLDFVRVQRHGIAAYQAIADEGLMVIVSGSTEVDGKRWVHVSCSRANRLPNWSDLGDCEGGERPCPYVSCAHHLYIDVNPKTGALKLSRPDLEVDQLAESCALDVADRGGITLDQVGEHLNLTRERVRQIEMTALAKLRRRHPSEAA